MSTIAERLREFRAAVGLTQREVASLCGLGKRTIIYWEMGEREVRCTKLIPLVEEYDLDFNWLILGTGNMFGRSETLSMADPNLGRMEPPPVAPSSEPSPAPDRDSPVPTEDDTDQSVLPLIQRLRRK